MPNLTLLGWMFLAWGVVTGVLAVLLIYRSVVGMKEDDQLFLDAAESRFEEEQHAILAKLDRIQPYVKGLGIASGGILAAMLGLVAYRVGLALYLDGAVR
ncbi:MAG: hypothetical protein ACKV22_22490 [Bryobacteraceae bacterium]